MDLAETFVRYLVTYALEHCREDLGLFAEFVDKTLMDTLETLLPNHFIRLPYTEAVDILNRSANIFLISSFLWRRTCKPNMNAISRKPISNSRSSFMIIPRTIKPFYMRVNDDGRTVAAMDVIVPRIGEIIGGSQREERLDVLEGRMDETGVPQETSGGIWTPGDSAACRTADLAWDLNA